MFESPPYECKWKEALYKAEKRCMYTFPSSPAVSRTHLAKAVAERGNSGAAWIGQWYWVLAAAPRAISKDLSRTCLLGQHMVC